MSLNTKFIQIDGKDLNKVWTGFSILLIIVIGIQYINTDENQFYNGMLETEKEKSYQGVVSQKFIDYENHAIRTVVINTINVPMHTEFYKKINVGDSLSKKKGDPIVWLYKKNGEILFFDHKKEIEDIIRLKNQQRSE